MTKLFLLNLHLTVLLLLNVCYVEDTVQAAVGGKNRCVILASKDSKI